MDFVFRFRPTTIFAIGVKKFEPNFMPQREVLNLFTFVHVHLSYHMERSATEKPVGNIWRAAIW